MRTIHFEAQFGWYPLWETATEDGMTFMEEVDPESLPLSDALRRRIARWAERWDATFDHGYPPDSGFAGEEEARDFFEEGVRIAAALREVLRDCCILVADFEKSTCAVFRKEVR